MFGAIRLWLWLLSSLPADFNFAIQFPERNSLIWPEYFSPKPIAVKYREISTSGGQDKHQFFRLITFESEFRNPKPFSYSALPSLIIAFLS